MAYPHLNTKGLRDMLEHVRSEMKPEDCTGICVRGRDENNKCMSGCPGADKPDTQCYMLEGYDDRPTEVIAKEVESRIFGRMQ